MKWTCPHKGDKKTLIIRGYKKDYETRRLIYGRLCPVCYAYYAGTSFTVEINGTVSRVGLAASVLKTGGSEKGV